MKRILTILLIVLWLSVITLPVAGAKDNSGNGAGNSGGDTGASPVIKNGIGGIQSAGSENRNEPRARNQTGNETSNLVQNRTQTQNQTKERAVTPPGQNVSMIREMIRLERQQMNATGPQRNASQNEVRLAVHALLAMENMTGGIGPQVSAIAQDFNNSVQAEYQLEERIQNRGSFTRFFFGGDRAAARDLGNLTIQNQDRIRLIEQLMNSENLDADTRVMLQEQLQTMEQENTRLNQTASAELQNRGILGWLGM